MPIRENSYTNIETAAYAMADSIAATLRDAISERGQALLAVSGGRTPKYVFERLHQANLDWEQVTITLTDERWVAADHPDSNEGLVRKYLLQGQAKSATFIPLYGAEELPEAGQSSCEARLKSITMPFDAVYLGMGGDGHFASLFPGDPALEIRNSLCVAVSASGSRTARMSLTAPTILNAKNIFLLFSGKDKHAMYAKAKEAGLYKEIPLRLVTSQTQNPVYVFMSP